MKNFHKGLKQGLREKEIDEAGQDFPSQVLTVAAKR